MSKYVNNKFFVANKVVFFVSLALILVLILIGVAFPEAMNEKLNSFRIWSSNSFGWFFTLTVNVILIFTIYIALSKYGRIRLGGEDARPAYSKASWFAMLFSAGMGIGIMFYSIGEPVTHFGTPPLEVGSKVEAAKQAMDFTNLHYGLHVWAIYALVGLALAFFAYNKNLPMTFRSAFYPFIGDKINGIWGDIIDILSALATVFGLATTLGLGVMQVSTGLEFLYGWEVTPMMQIVIILAVIAVATVSVFLGVDKGVKRLSSVNMYMALLLLAFVFVFGPTLSIMKGFVENTGSYLSNLTVISTWNEKYMDSNWQNTWTIFYWGWWIAWSPFVGTFIAQISKGRTVREFILGVVLIPSLIVIFWMNAFGGSALDMIINGDTTMLLAVQEDMTSSLFVFLENFPLVKFSSILAIVLVFSFFITSPDSGSLVINTITAGTEGENTPVWQRVLWSFIQGAVAIVLLLSGGLGALQTGVIAIGLPFAVVLLVLCYSLHKGLKEAYFKSEKALKVKQEDSYRDTINRIVEEEQNNE